MVDLTQDDVMHDVVIVAFDGVQSLDITGPAEVFAGATTLMTHRATGIDPLDTHASGATDRRVYRVSIVSRAGGIVETESAVRLDTEPFGSVPHRIDTLVVPGGFSVWRHAADDDFLDDVRDLIHRTRRLVTVCSGAAIAAAAGALDGHRVTTHWARAERIAAEHPCVEVDADPIFIESEHAGRTVWSSAGVTAGIDLCLALVERDHGTDVAQEVGRWLVMYLRRPGGQSQFASPSWIRQPADGPIRLAQQLIIDDPAADHRISRLAERVGMSERHLVRRFTDEVGIPPARFVARVRVDAARHDLERTDDNVSAIARRCGFGTAETMRRTLQRHVGVSPEAYRRRFGHQQTGTPDQPTRHPSDQHPSDHHQSDHHPSERTPT